MMRAIPVEPIHPSVFILEEVAARGWTLDFLALAMGRAADFQLNRLALDFYVEIGPEIPNMRIGERMAADLAAAFDVSAELFLNLERAWLSALEERQVTQALLTVEEVRLHRMLPESDDELRARMARQATILALRSLGLERLPPTRPGGFRTWRDDEIDAYRAHWTLGTLARLVFELAIGTGASPVDLVKLGWGNVRGDRVQYRRQKTERRKGAEETPLVDIPILPALAEVLAAVPRERATFLETEGGLPRSQGALVHNFRAWVAAAGLNVPDRHGRNLTPHGLRKALGRRLAEAGASPHVIMAVLGHESIASAQVYTKAYDRARAADLAAELLAGTEDDRKANANVRTFRRERPPKSGGKPLK